MFLVCVLASSYIVLTHNAIRVLSKIFRAFDEVLGRKWVLPHKKDRSVLVAAIIFLCLCWFLGFLALFASVKVMLGKQVLSMAKEVPENQITMKEEGALLRFIDVLEKE